MLLKELCQCSGVSGNEDEVSNLILKNIKADRVTVDSMGNIIAFKKGTVGNKHIMVTAHMDEVGFIISSVDGDFLRFKTVGGIDAAVLCSKRVLIGGIEGVIGLRAVHLQKKEEREKTVEQKELYIDIGGGMEDLIGEYGAFKSDFVEFGNKIKAKALDDRVGCALLLDLLQNSYPCDITAVFTVQEEVGLRGAKIAAHAVKPDLAIVLEGTTCADVYNTPEHEQVTQQGKGVALTFMDNRMIVNKALLEKIKDIAIEKNILWQYKKTTLGGTDGGAIHTSNEGIPTAILAVPCRYIHSPSCVMDKRDFDAFCALAHEVLLKGEEI